MSVEAEPAFCPAPKINRVAPPKINRDPPPLDSQPPAKVPRLVKQTEVLDLTGEDDVAPPVHFNQPTGEDGLRAQESDGFDMEACLNRGHPMTVEWGGKSREFVDGFGLCSPGR